MYLLGLHKPGSWEGKLPVLHAMNQEERVFDALHTPVIVSTSVQAQDLGAERKPEPSNPQVLPLWQWLSATYFQPQDLLIY